MGRRGGAAGGGRGGAHERRASPPVDSMLRHRRESERDDWIIVARFRGRRASAGGLRLRRAVHRRVPREELTQRDVGAAARAQRRRRRARGIPLQGDEEPLGASPRVPRRRREHLAADARDPEPADAPRVLVLVSVVHRGRGNRGRRRRHRRVSRASAARVNHGWRSSRGEGLSRSLNFVRISVGCEAMSCPTNLFVVASGSARAALATRVGRPGGLHRDRGSTDDGASDAPLASRSIRFGRGTGVDRGGGNLGRRRGGGEHCE